MPNGCFRINKVRDLLHNKKSPDGLGYPILKKDWEKPITSLCLLKIGGYSITILRPKSLFYKTSFQRFHIVINPCNEEPRNSVFEPKRGWRGIDSRERVFERGAFD